MSDSPSLRPPIGSSHWAFASNARRLPTTYSVNSLRSASFARRSGCAPSLLSLGLASLLARRSSALRPFPLATCLPDAFICVCPSRFPYEDRMRREGSSILKEEQTHSGESPPSSPQPCWSQRQSKTETSRHQANGRQSRCIP